MTVFHFFVLIYKTEEIKEKFFWFDFNALKIFSVSRINTDVINLNTILTSEFCRSVRLKNVVIISGHSSELNEKD